MLDKVQGYIVRHHFFVVVLGGVSIHWVPAPFSNNPGFIDRWIQVLYVVCWKVWDFKKVQIPFLFRLNSRKIYISLTPNPILLLKDCDLDIKKVNVIRRRGIEIFYSFTTKSDSWLCKINLSRCIIYKTLNVTYVIENVRDLRDNVTFSLVCVMYLLTRVDTMLLRIKYFCLSHHSF